MKAGSISRKFLLAWGILAAMAAIPAGEVKDFRTGEFPSTLEGTRSLDLPADILVRQHDQIDEYWSRQIAATPSLRDALWKPDFSSVSRYQDSLRKHRVKLREILGVPAEIKIDPGRTRRHVLLEATLRVEDVEVSTSATFVSRARIFRPPSPAGAAVIAIPPASTKVDDFAVLQGEATPEWLLSFLERGLTVAVPTIVRRSMDHPWSELSRGNQMSRRRFLHRLAFVVGETMTGLEVQQVLALKNYLQQERSPDPYPVAILGTGQGGMTAFYAAALDQDFKSVAVVDYFDQRENCWQEPVDRMLYGQLNEFGDAEVAALIAPRDLSVYFTPQGPVDPASVRVEADRALRFYLGLNQPDRFQWKEQSEPLLDAAQGLAISLTDRKPSPINLAGVDLGGREEERADANFLSLRRYLRELIQETDSKRASYWKLEQTPLNQRPQKVKLLKEELAQLMGVIDTSTTPLNPRSSLIEVTQGYAAYEVLLDVLEGVEAYGQLLIPRHQARQFPAVIAQHGGGGTPGKVTGIGEKEDTAYHEFARHLAEQGYVVFAPLVAVGNRPFPEVKEQQQRISKVITDAINPKVRKAAAVGMMRTSLEQAKLRKIVDFLQSLSFVKANQIGYYGLSYGGYSATWMTPLEPRIKASAISGHFNDWEPKITSERIATSYLRHPDEDFSNWNVLNRFTHVELIAAMWPRAVCVEYGEGDAVTPPGWFRTAWRELSQLAEAWDFKHRLAKVYFDGNHEIHGVHTLDFMNRWLRPEEAAGRNYTFLLPVRERGSVSEAEFRTEDHWVPHHLDSRHKQRIISSFFVPESRPSFSGIAIFAKRRGQPGDLILRFGTSPGADDIGLVRIGASEIQKESSWVEASLDSIQLEPGQTYFFEVTSEWGWERNGDFYEIYGPRPLGGNFIPPEIGLAYRSLDSQPGTQ